MKPILSEQERQRLDKRVAEVEARTGTQIVLAFVSRSDVYAELPWKAFALGAGLAGLATTLLDLLRPAWSSSHTILLTTTAILASGAACSLLCTTVPGFARIFLDGFRAETEVRQYAESLFLSRQVFATEQRRGVLLLVSLFEHKAVLLPDSGLKERLSPDAQKNVLARLTARIADGNIAAALEQGLIGLEEVMGAGPAGAAGKNELPDSVVEEEGV
ncbi:MAG: TPM domain-containing protein [Nitrospirota bacterium]|nr:TPM domain-containing protein [Nitrospirota bacterium]